MIDPEKVTESAREVMRTIVERLAALDESQVTYELAVQADRPKGCPTCDAKWFEGCWCNNVDDEPGKRK